MLENIIVIILISYWPVLLLLLIVEVWPNIYKDFLRYKLEDLSGFEETFEPEIK